VQLPALELHLHVRRPPSVPRARASALTARPRRTKESQPEEDPSVAARLQRLQNNYEDWGMRRTVEGILVVHDHGHPHILMIQIANAFFKLCVLSPAPPCVPFPRGLRAVRRARSGGMSLQRSMRSDDVVWTTMALCIGTRGLVPWEHCKERG
jgi:hypothetical protein